MKIFKTIIRPVVTYSPETWTLTAKDEKTYIFFKGKYLEDIWSCQYLKYMENMKQHGN